MECKIVLWRIEGFDSSAPVPPSDAAPSTHVFRETRSAFGGGYQRLLQFETVDTTPFYMRFSLFSQPFRAPILVIGNEKSKVFFWDLQRLETWTEKDDVRPRFPSKKSSKQPSVGLREASVASTMSSSVHPGSNDSQSSAGSGFPRSKERYGVEDPFKAIKPHKSLTVPRIEFAARRAAWSVGGEWLLVVGDQGMIATFHR
jgi:polycomb protein EED